MTYRLALPPSWRELDLPEVPGVLLAAVRPGGDGFTPSLAVSQPLAAPTMRLLDSATGRSATAAQWVEVLDTSPVEDRPGTAATVVRRLRARSADGADLLQWLVLATDGHGAVVHLALSTSTDPSAEVLGEVAAIIGSLAAVGGPD